MKVVVTPFAQQQIWETAAFIQHEFGKSHRLDFMQKVRKIKRLISANPHLGPIEPNLAGLSTDYRSVVVAQLNKIVYRIEDDRIDIVDFWDVRRDPESLAAQVR